jgi:hypothetical protein
MRDPGHGLEGPRATELAIIQARRDPGREQEGTLGSVTQPQRRCVCGGTCPRYAPVRAAEGDPASTRRRAGRTRPGLAAVRVTCDL